MQLLDYDDKHPHQEKDKKEERKPPTTLEYYTILSIWKVLVASMVAHALSIVTVISLYFTTLDSHPKIAYPWLLLNSLLFIQATYSIHNCKFGPRMKDILCTLRRLQLPVGEAHPYDYEGDEKDSNVIQDYLETTIAHCIGWSLAAVSSPWVSPYYEMAMATIVYILIRSFRLGKRAVVQAELAEIKKRTRARSS